jgi:UDP-N-acetylmuramate dehydrogenase
MSTYPNFDHARLSEPMSLHTTFKVGGPADVFVTPESVSEFVSVLETCRREGLDHFVLGKGSDLLVADEGYRGVVIALDNLTSITREGNTLVCEAGASLKDVAERAAAESLAGFEFASGIPGSIGGACFMNAGAYEGCMADVLESIDVIEPDGSTVTLAVEDLELGYRSSKVRNDGLVVVRARIALTPGDEGEIRAKIADLTQRREEKQPLEYGSAGSTFKRPQGYFAGKLIMDAGLKGYRVGDAAVSEKHAGFVINLDHATAEDVRAVISHVQDVVYETYGVRLETEVLFVGF